MHITNECESLASKHSEVLRGLTSTWPRAGVVDQICTSRLQFCENNENGEVVGADAEAIGMRVEL